MHGRNNGKKLMAVSALHNMPGVTLYSLSGVRFRCSKHFVSHANKASILHLQAVQCGMVYTCMQASNTTVARPCYSACFQITPLSNLVCNPVQVRIVQHSMDIIHLLTDQNPIQVVVDAIINR